VQGLANSEFGLASVAVEKPALNLPCAIRFSLHLKREESHGRPFDIAELTTQMARGDEDAYRQFYDLYFHRLLRYLLVATHGEEQKAREALQATLVRVVRYMKRFESEQTFWSWLTVLARSTLFDEHRKEARYSRLLRRFLRPEPPPAPNDDEDFGAQLQLLLDSNLRALSAEDRDLIERKYFAKQPVREIAAAQGSTEKAIESRLVRIRRRLKELIVQELNNEKQN
jgi:RNA polymerase sigma-70 factor (ECF subfamily)